MSLNLTGQIKILKDERGVYKTTLSTKETDENGEESKVFMQINVGFKKGTELKNKSVIEIKDGFVSFFRVKNKEENAEDKITYRSYIKLIVLDFELIEEGIDEVYSYRKPEENKKDHTFNYSDFNIGSTDDLPF